MVACILALAGTCLLFFGYDAAVMSLVNINPNYLQHMDSAGGTDRDAARVGGIVSFWFLGFLVGTYFPPEYFMPLFSHLKGMPTCGGGRSKCPN